MVATWTSPPSSSRNDAARTILFVVTSVLAVICIETAQSESANLSAITYSYTTCGISRGRNPPATTSCTDFYEQADSLIFLDNQVGSFSMDYEGAQSFQVRKTGMYDITVAGAAGGRGLCSTEFGRGAVVKVRVQLEAGQEALILVGHRGAGPCDTNPEFELCQNPPKNLNESYQCGSDWNDTVNSFDGHADVVYTSQGGAGGGGASMVWLRQSKKGFAEQPLVVGGGGGGTPSVFPDPSTFDLVRVLLESDDATDSNDAFYQHYLDGKMSQFDEDTEDIQGTTGLRLWQNSPRSGAGGGWNSRDDPAVTDGKALSSGGNSFAFGGRRCNSQAISSNTFLRVLDNANGGFGGGGGGCGGGGGGGGYTGGTVISNISFAGSGGYSYAQDSIEIVSVSSNKNIGNGYIDIVPAKCGCAGSCVITGDQFECTCPEGTSLAFDNNDCYNSTDISITDVFYNEPIEIEGYETVFASGWSFHQPVLLYSVEVELQFHPLEFTTRDTDEENCVLLFVSTNSSIFLASTIVTVSGRSSVGLAQVTVMDQDEVTIYDYEDILEYGVDVTGVVAIGNTYCMITNLLANISIVQTDNEMANINATRNLQNNVELLEILTEEVFPLTVLPSPQVTPNPSSSDSTPIIIAVVSSTTVVIAALIFVGLVLMCVFCRRKRQRIKRMSMIEDEVIPRKNSDMRYIENDCNEQRKDSLATLLSGLYAFDDSTEVLFTEAQREFYQKKFSDVLVAYADLEIERKSIGEGVFGKVYKGVVEKPDDQIEVAVKTIKYATERELEAFFEETFLMKNFSHPNIVGLLGVCLDSEDGFPYIVMPFMSNGNLKEFLKRNRIHLTDISTMPRDLPLPVMLEMCINIAEGMKYLAENKFVHRDLAARNCMVDKDLKVKVGDFGLARDIYSENYYRARRGAKLPVKWMPPETLRDGISNEKTDVWSFGVTLWEVFSLGSSPYAGIENCQLLQYLTIDEQRLQKPKLCPEDLFPVVQRCWNILPEERPTFGTLVILLQDYRDEQELYI